MCLDPDGADGGDGATHDVSDAPGDGTPPDPQRSCGDDELAGTCAEELGAMFHACFDPAGDCIAYEDDAGVLQVLYDSGARLSLTETRGAETITVFAASGERCGVETITAAQRDADSRTITPEGGAAYEVRNEGTQIYVTCPDQTEIALEQSFAFARCAGFLFGCEVITAASCTRDEDCDAGSSCCRFGGAEAFAELCVPSGSCPN